MEAQLSINASRVIGMADKFLYGGFTEHLGRCIYGGVFDPEDPTADADGFRQDTLAAIRDLDVPIIRYPGGCFTDLWCWEDGVGPQRKVRLDPAWRQLEPNTFGLHEFIKWCRKADAEPMLTINVGLRSTLDAARMWEYCNFPKGTHLSDLRAANGSPEPFGVKYFCLGNELYADWEFGQMDAGSYALQAREVAKVLKSLDPDIKLILCGCGTDNAWNRQILELCYDQVDYISLHFGFATNDPEEKIYSDLQLHERTLVECDAISREIQKAHKSAHRVKVSIDEWIIWDGDARNGAADEYTVGRHLLEQDFTIRETILAGAVISRLFHKHCDCVSIACVAQSVNVISSLRTAPGGILWRQGNFFPMWYASHYGRGQSITVEGLPAGINASAILGNNGEIAIFLTSFSRETCRCSVAITGFVLQEIAEAVTLHCDDETAFNTPEKTPLKPMPFNECAIAEDGAFLELPIPPRSWSCIRVRMG